MTSIPETIENVNKTAPSTPVSNPKANQPPSVSAPGNGNAGTSVSASTSPSAQGAPNPSVPCLADPKEYSDLQLAREFADRLRMIVAGNRVWNENKRVWSGDDDLNEVVRAIYPLAHEKASSLPFNCGNLAATLESRRKMENIQNIVSNLLNTKKVKWNPDPFVIGVPGGKVVDLRTGTMRPAERTDYVTKSVSVAPAQEESCPLWKKFLSEIQPPETVAYLKRLVGYVLTGSVSEEMFAFLIGTGRNGKGTFIKILLEGFGTYAGVLPPATLLSGKKDRHPTEIAKLEGLRLASCSEIQEGREWNESAVKSLTGGDRQTARKMRQDFSDFDQTHKILIDANNTPSLKKIDVGIRRRLHLVPFAITILEEKQNKKLKEQLLAELPGILRWAINGSLEWQRDGLKPPAPVIGATEEYFQQQDLVSQWLNLECDVADNALARKNFKEKSKDYFQSWTEFCEEQNEEPGTQRKFTEKLLKLELGFQPCVIGKENASGLCGFRLKQNAARAHNSLEDDGRLPADHIVEWLEKNRKVGETFSIDQLVEGLKDHKPPIAALRSTIQYVVSGQNNVMNLVQSGLAAPPVKGEYRWKGKQDDLAKPA